ncbi:MAG: hypothetical protein IPK19_25415 [Chloroflexi bacterium]|nr:hypothetical protein [Chloroflexota bacterium]
MSRRLLTFISLLLLLAAFSVAQAQDTTSDGPRFVLTEEQINADFRIANTATRQISNLDVKVKEDGLHVSFQMTVTRDGTSNTLSIIAILIGLFDQPRVSAIELENTLISNYIVPASLRREVTSLLTSSWRSYEAGLLADLQIDEIPANGFIMSDGRICNPRWGC